MACVTVVCAILFAYHYSSNGNKINDEKISASQTENRDQDHSESDARVIQTDVKEVINTYVSEGKSEHCSTDSSSEIINQNHSESIHETLEIVLEDMQLIKGQIKELREKQDINNAEVSEPGEKDSYVEALCNNVSVRLDETESLIEKVETKLANLSNSFSELYNKRVAEMERLNLSLSSLKDETNNNISEVWQTLTEINKQEADLEGKIQKIVAEIMDIKEASGNTDKQMEDLLALVENRIYPNTINKSM